MRLRELATRLDDLADDLTIYIEQNAHRSGTSEVVVARERDTDPDWRPDGFQYFLEVDLAKEVVRVWSAWRGGQRPSSGQAAEALLHYAVHDAYQPTAE